MPATRTDGPGRVEALLLIGHGSARYADAGRVLEAQAEALRETGRFAAVGVGFLAGTPTPAEDLAALSAPTIHIVPLFMEDGYFTRVALPRALGLTSPTAGDPPAVDGPPPSPLRGRAGEGGKQPPGPWGWLRPCHAGFPPVPAPE